MEVDGRRIRVDYSITKRPHTPTPGVYMGRPTRNSSPDDYHKGGSSGSETHNFFFFFFCKIRYLIITIVDGYEF